jgi:NTP pyrophosphatase (non-canonical NTP hydrolase)
MTLNEYQRGAVFTAQYPDNAKILYPAMGMAGEAGEALEKVKKALRKGGVFDYGAFLDEEGLIKEMGDVLWYVANLAEDMQIDLETVAQINLNKLADRAQRDVIKGEGDNR